MLEKISQHLQPQTDERDGEGNNKKHMVSEIFKNRAKVVGGIRSLEFFFVFLSQGNQIACYRRKLFAWRVYVQVPRKIIKRHVIEIAYQPLLDENRHQ